MYFIKGYAWVFIASAILWLTKVNQWPYIIGVSFFLQTLYVVTFSFVYKATKKEVVIPSLSLVTLQVFTFLTFLFVFIANHWSVYAVFWTLMVFFGTLIIQVLEQRNYLKSLEKPEE
jgi:hypothetical protein